MFQYYSSNHNKNKNSNYSSNHNKTPIKSKKITQLAVRKARRRMGEQPLYITVKLTAGNSPCSSSLNTLVHKWSRGMNTLETLGKPENIPAAGWDNHDLQSARREFSQDLKWKLCSCIVSSVISHATFCIRTRTLLRHNNVIE